jgi:hypothetical protein
MYFITDLNKILKLLEIEVHRISSQSPCEGGKVVTPTDWLSLPPRICPCYSCMLDEIRTIVLQKGLNQIKTQ